VVEMDDWDQDADAFVLDEGEKVRVIGRIDDDFFEARTLEAASVFVERHQTYHFVSSADEEDSLFSLFGPVQAGSVTVQGRVTAIEGDELVIDTGARSLRVETEEMPTNPLDDEGVQQIEIGSLISVTGTLDHDFLEGRELVAIAIITLSRDQP